MGTYGTSCLLEAELKNRMSIPWIIEPAPRMTLVLVDGNEHPSVSEATARIYLSAKALGIDLVVLDNHDHWLEGPDFQDWRQAFLPTKLFQPPHTEMASHILASIRRFRGRVDGITTFRDSYKASVAEVATQLGLLAPEPDAYAIATDKHRLSVFEAREAYRVSSKGNGTTWASQTPSTWPVMVKPCSGVSSNGCFRVDNASDLKNALKKIHHFDISLKGVEYVIEPFCFGPEVFANFVLLDGKILFSEITDVFPKTAEQEFPGANRAQTFVEQDVVIPSKLPSAELDLLRDCFHRSLLSLGIRHGVLHLEGRVKHSRMEYKAKDGVMDLHRRTTALAFQPSPWLIEINPRPPGSTVPELTQCTYGIDYRGLELLLALGDRQRAEALSQPFHDGPMNTTAMVVIQADYDHASCEGIFDSDDICADLLSRRPDLAKHISKCGCFIKRGERVLHPSSGSNKWIAYFHVVSPLGRTKTLQLAHEVRQETRYRFR